MRQVGMRAFQTALFPHLPPAEIQRLNHLDAEILKSVSPSVIPEIERALFVSEPSVKVAHYQIHPVGDLIEVYLNLLQWNRELASEEGKRLWGGRLVTYFVYQPDSDLFAPSKFCAYSAIPEAGGNSSQPIGAGLGRMTIAVYALLNESTHIMDGNRAQVHLTNHLGMLARTAEEAPQVNQAFVAWLGRNSDVIQVHPRGAVFLLPPSWFDSGERN
jgi:hypothetical protein